MSAVKKIDAREFAFVWGAEFDHELTQILRGYRLAGRDEGSLGAQLDYEKRLAEKTRKKLQQLIERFSPAALDCVIIDAVDAAKAAHDGAREREIVKFGAVRAL
jgi:hypothetical protein